MKKPLVDLFFAHIGALVNQCYLKKALFSLILVLTCSWSSDFAAGLERSQIEKRPLLVFFTASDWSGWSIKFKDEVLTNKKFKEKIEADFVCVEIDTPLHASPSKEGERFGITEFPTILVFTADQREIARFGYLPMTGEQLADDLHYILAQDRDLSYLVDLLARGERTQAILEKAYHLAEELCNEQAINLVLNYGIESRDPGFFLVEKYRRTADEKVREKLIELDEPELLFHVALLDFQEKSDVQPLEDFLQKYGNRAEKYRWQLEMMISQFYLDQDQVELAIEHGELAQENAPTSRRDEITHSLNYMRSVER